MANAAGSLKTAKRVEFLPSVPTGRDRGRARLSARVRGSVCRAFGQGSIIGRILSPLKTRWAVSGVVWVFAALLFFPHPNTWAQRKVSATKFEVKSAGFKHDGPIPKQYTCDGANVSPALSWTNPPAGTQSYALIMDDPDAPAGTFVHWVAYNLPATVRQIPEGVPGNDDIPGGGLQGANAFPQTGYGGPCPPPGKPHRYFFKLYALDTKLDLRAGARKKDVEEAMKGHVLAEAQLMGRYGR